MVKNILAGMLESAEKLLKSYEKTSGIKGKVESFKRRRIFWLQMYRTLSYVLPILKTQYNDLDIRLVTTLNDQIVRFLYLDSQDNSSEEEKVQRLEELEQNMQHSLRMLPEILRAQNQEHEIQQTVSENVPVDPGKEENRK